MKLTLEHKRKISMAMKGRIPKNCGKEFTHKDHSHTLDVRKRLSVIKMGAFIGNRNPLWKGDEVGYRSLHYWVSTHLGKPKICEHCGKTGLDGKKIQWANKSHKYRRDLTDWLRLCVPCHKKYDRK